MRNQLERLSESAPRRLLIEAATRAVSQSGHKLVRVPGRGLSSVWNAEKNGKKFLISLRTTRDRWIAYPPVRKGAGWKTLDDVDRVLIASVDSKANPNRIEVYLLPAADIRRRFDAAYAARTAAGQRLRDNFGMWVSLDPDSRGIAASAGSGIVDGCKPLATYSIEELLPASAAAQEDVNAGESSVGSPPLSTIAELMAWTRERAAAMAGVPMESVKLDLRVEY